MLLFSGVPGTNLKAGLLYKSLSSNQNHFNIPQFNVQKRIFCHGDES